MSKAMFFGAAMLAAAWVTTLSAGAEKPAAPATQPASQPAAAPNTLTAEEKAAGFVLLFDGKTLEGWKVSENPKSFKVEDGKIITAGPRAHAYYMGPVAEHEFKNFELRARVLTHKNSNSGIYFHVKYQEKGFPLAQGFEAQICSNAYKDPKKTGSIYNFANVKQSPVQDDEWFDYAIIVKGDKATTLLNAKVAAEYVDKDNKRLKGGTFALQCHDPGSTVEFHTMRVRVLPAEEAK